MYVFCSKLKENVSNLFIIHPLSLPPTHKSSSSPSLSLSSSQVLKSVSTQLFIPALIVNLIGTIRSYWQLVSKNDLHNIDYRREYFGIFCPVFFVPDISPP